MEWRREMEDVTSGPSPGDARPHHTPISEPSGDGARRADTSGPTRRHVMEMELLLGVETSSLPAGLASETGSSIPTRSALRAVVIPVRAAAWQRRPTRRETPPFGLSFGPDELVHRVQQQREKPAPQSFATIWAAAALHQRYADRTRRRRSPQTRVARWARPPRCRLRRRLFSPLPPPRPPPSLPSHFVCTRCPPTSAGNRRPSSPAPPHGRESCSAQVVAHSASSRRRPHDNALPPSVAPSPQKQRPRR